MAEIEPLRANLYRVPLPEPLCAAGKPARSNVVGRTSGGTHGFGLDEYMPDALSTEDGYVLAPGHPGHGVELDFDRLAAHRW